MLIPLSHANLLSINTATASTPLSQISLRWHFIYVVDIWMEQDSGNRITNKQVKTWKKQPSRFEKKSKDV